MKTIKLAGKKEKKINKKYFSNYKESWANLLIECYEDFKKNDYKFTEIKHSKYFIISKINNISILNLFTKPIKKYWLKKIDVKDIEGTFREFKDYYKLTKKMEKNTKCK